MQPTDTEYLEIPLDEIVASLTNPRTIFDPEYIDSLAVTIKADRVHQAIVVRPLPAARVPDTDRKVKYEIVFGECRWRGSGVAGKKTIPAVLRRDLTDAQVVTIQLIENLKRKDLSVLEEAQGYRRLIDEQGMKAEDIAEQIDKSRTHIYNQLKLLDLGAEGRTALREGKIEASTAMLVARIPDAKQQVKALKEILSGGSYNYGNNEPMSFRRAQEMVQRDFMLKLSDARFKITAVDLVPGVGSCKECPKRTGANQDLFADVKSADVCTDPPCFHKKEEAATKLLVKEAEAKGQTVIAGKEAEELHTGWGASAKFKGYKRLDEKEDSPTGEPLRKIIGKLMEEKGIKPTMLEHPTKKGQLVAALPNDVANSLLKIVQQQAKADKKAVPAAVQDLLNEKASQEKARLDSKYLREVRAQIISETWAIIHQRGELLRPNPGFFNLDVHRHLASHTAWSLDADGAEAASKVLSTGSVGAQHGLRELVKKHPRPDLLHLLLIMHNRSGEGFNLVTKAVHGDDPKAFTKRIEAEVKERIYPKPEKKAPTANAPAAQAKNGAGGKTGAKGKPSTAPGRAPKISAEDAKRGIADALQGIEGAASAPKGAVAPPAGPAGKAVPAWPFPTGAQPGRQASKPNAAQEAAATAPLQVGQAVRVISDKTLLGGLAAKWAGRDGTIHKDMGDGVYNVKLKRGGAMPFNAGQLEVVA